ncbi:glutathione S-transferase [Mycena olivaceomarginata]|nr:glutathione S-transferase [Mycena olivaceomarginata]
MAILKLYGASQATCTRRVATVLHELKVPFELVEDDDGFILYETRAICRYIAAKHPESGLIPTDPKANALFEQAASVELSNWDPSASKAGVELMRKRVHSPPSRHALNLEGYEAILSKQRYVAGDSFTLADLFHIPYAPLVASGGSDIMTRKPNVARWYNELVARPSWLAYQDGGVKTTAAY